MHTLLIVLLIITCVLLVTAVVLQPSKDAGLSGALTGGAEQLFGKKKVRGVELVLHRATVILSIVFFVLVILLSFFVK
ncbi:preprotein translocase subunit SecG [Brochothrix campestris]|uniref:Protein-export membrane protein SecG n=1 Tax=Brochothrix campestris FSL F6-1037 TaxID=1265861 RepID=W7D1X7_9LIST|nr:preprotein translocase subunit SecG [Brochothrix campestris]EUJ41941.1 preprotein translocase subunit SecG [Brochothrix campestris FSL F6-1037]